MNDSQLLNISVTRASRGVILVIVESLIFIVLDIIAFVGNVLVCFVFYRNRSLRTITNIFVLSLVLTDLFMAVLIMPPTFVLTTTNKLVTGGLGIQVVTAAGFTLSGVSLLTMMLLAINRYFRVVRPTVYRNIYSKKSSTILASFAWVTTIITIVSAVTFTGIRFQPNANASAVLPFFPNTNAVVLFYVLESIYIIVPSSVCIACYVKIYQAIHQHNTAVVPSRSGGHLPYGVEEAKTTRLLTVILVAFYFCWMPAFVSSILILLKVIDDSGLLYYNFYHNFPVYASSAINPIIYATMNRQFRAEFLKILCFNYAY